MSSRRPGIPAPALLPVLLAVALILGSSLAFAWPAAAGAATGELAGPVYCTRVYLDGQRIVLPVPAVVADGHTLVPGRAVFEKLGATVLWDGLHVVIKNQDRRIDLSIGSDLATVDDHLVPLEAPAVLWESRLMVPLRFVVQHMGLGVSWDAERRAVLLSTAPANPGGDEAGSGGETGSGSGGTAQAPEIKDVTLAFGGDVMMALWVGDLIATKGADYPWGGIAPTLSAADIAMVNLECCVSTQGAPYDKLWTFRADPISLDGVANAGVDIVSLANNHTGDYGTAALVDTLAYIDEHGIARVGAGANKTEAWQPVILEAGGYKVGFLAGTVFYPEIWIPTDERPGICSARDVEALAAAVSDLDSQVDYTVVNMHWGIEYDTNPDAFQRRCGRALVDAGADLVIGHHPHILQGIEVYKDKAIVYSLGNLVFTYKNREAQDSGMILATFDEAGLASVRFLPCFTDTGRTVLEDGEDYDRILANMNTWSAEWDTSLDPLGYVMLP